MPLATFAAPPRGAPGRGVDTHLWPRLFADGEYRRLCEEMIFVIDAVGRSVYFPRDANTPQEIDRLLNLFFSFVVDSSFVIPDDMAERFIGLNHGIASLTAISSFRTTDAQLEILKKQPNNFVKILALYSARNRVQFDRTAIFQVQPALASMWYVRFGESFHCSIVSPQVCANLREHFAFVPPRLVGVAGVQEPFFGVSYVDPALEAPLKLRVNQAARERACRLSLSQLNPDPMRIAVVTAHWSPGHSVYRIVQGLISALKPRYHLTFFRLGHFTDHDTSLFDECREIAPGDGVPDPAVLRSGRYQAILYPDIGMDDQSIFLSNMRLAPLQIAFTGHSVSTFGADIDYYISGAGVERPDHPEQHYSERLVLLPGMGCIHKRPVYTMRRTRPAPFNGRMIINCPWTGTKINCRLLEMVKQIAARSTRPVQFRVFAGGSLSVFKDATPFDLDFFSSIPREQAEVFYYLKYPQYMEKMEEGHFSLDPFHFGGCNTVSDSLFLRLPIICREGERWYNRIGPAMLRRAGLPELIARTGEEYLTLALKMIHDDAWREAVTGRLWNADLDATVYDTSDAEAFARGFEDLVANHERYRQSGSREPIRVPART